MSIYDVFGRAGWASSIPPSTSAPVITAVHLSTADAFSLYNLSPNQGVVFTVLTSGDLASGIALTPTDWFLAPPGAHLEHRQNPNKISSAYVVVSKPITLRAGGLNMFDNARDIPAVIEVEPAT